MQSYPQEITYHPPGTVINNEVFSLSEKVEITFKKTASYDKPEYKEHFKYTISPELKNIPKGLNLISPQYRLEITVDFSQLGNSAPNPYALLVNCMATISTPSNPPILQFSNVVRTGDINKVYQSESILRVYEAKVNQLRDLYTRDSALYHIKPASLMVDDKDPIYTEDVLLEDEIEEPGVADASTMALPSTSFIENNSGSEDGDQDLDDNILGGLASININSGTH